MGEELTLAYAQLLNDLSRSATIRAIFPEYPDSVKTDEDVAAFVAWWERNHG